MKQYSIVPKQFTKTATKITINNIVINLDHSANISYLVVGDNGTDVFSVSTLHLEGADYNAWGNDDTYIAQLICVKEGLTLA